MSAFIPILTRRLIAILILSVGLFLEIVDEMPFSRYTALEFFQSTCVWLRMQRCNNQSQFTPKVQPNGSVSLHHFPEYTSPPLKEALKDTPFHFVTDDAMNIARALAASGNCTLNNLASCQILFHPPSSFRRVRSTNSSSRSSSGHRPIHMGVVLYGAAMVDPRGYAPIAFKLSQEYGMAVSIPIFPKDYPTLFVDGKCGTGGRFQLAQMAFPHVDQWILVGHSFGGIAAQNEFWNLTMESSENRNEAVGGLVLLGSYIRQDVCAEIDFSKTNYPMADVQATLDGIVNRTNQLNGTKFLPQNTTFHLSLKGGNHERFGSYDASGRITAFGGALDREAIMPRRVQQELVVRAIVHVATQLGYDIERVNPTEQRIVNTSQGVNHHDHYASYATVSHSNRTGARYEFGRKGAEGRLSLIRSALKSST